MTPQEITTTLKTLFDGAVQVAEPDSWQVETGDVRLLVLLSEDRTWLRALISIAKAEDAQPYLEQLLEANFDETQEARYALAQRVLWGVFQHAITGLTVEDFQAAIARLLVLKEQALQDSFNRLAETQILQIIQAAKLQGQTLQETLQTLDRFYQEGVMGDIDQNTEQRQQVMGAWRYQLERLWNQVE
jgi:hypothetical protein